MRRRQFGLVAVVVVGVISLIGVSSLPVPGGTAAEPPRVVQVKDALPLAAFSAQRSVPTPTLAPTTTTAAPTTTTAAPTTTTLPPWSVGNRGDFALPPGAKLPSEAECRKRVRKAPELRPENAKANRTRPSARATFSPTQWGSKPLARTHLGRVTGDFVGTTDEAIQWASCKWGFEADVTRAQAVVESGWRQAATAGPSEDQADCVGEGVVAPCPTAFGLLQVRSDYHPGTWPASAESTAFNLDYSLALKRACYEGGIWLGPQTRGDAWGCVGVHYSGGWHDDGAEVYIEKVQARYASKPWQRW